MGRSRSVSRSKSRERSIEQCQWPANFVVWLEFRGHARVTHVFWSNVSGVASHTASARVPCEAERVARTAVRALFTFNTLTHDHRVHIHCGSAAHPHLSLLWTPSPLMYLSRQSPARPSLSLTTVSVKIRYLPPRACAAHPRTVLGQFGIPSSAMSPPRVSRQLR